MFVFREDEARPRSTLRPNTVRETFEGGWYGTRRLGRRRLRRLFRMGDAPRLRYKYGSMAAYTQLSTLQILLVVMSAFQVAPGTIFSSYLRYM